MHSQALVDLFGQPVRELDAKILPFHQDVASSIQRVIEEILLQKVTHLYERAPSENLCMAGGGFTRRRDARCC
jgi:carbamoyltransferase